MCAKSYKFVIVSIVAMCLILCVLHINPEPLTTDEEPKMSKAIVSSTKNLCRWHRRMAFLVFALLYIAAVLTLNYNIGWPFDNGMDLAETSFRKIVFFCFILMSLSISFMLFVMIYEEIHGLEPWTTIVSGLEHAYFDLFWIVIASAQLES
jgi:magnesium-transporting ATPase (P-type)